MVYTRIGQLLNLSGHAVIFMELKCLGTRQIFKYSDANRYNGRLVFDYKADVIFQSQKHRMPVLVNHRLLEPLVSAGSVRRVWSLHTTSDKCWADCGTLPEVHEPFTRCKPPLRVTEGPSKSPQAWLPSFVDLGPDFNGAIVRNLVLSTT